VTLLKTLRQYDADMGASREEDVEGGARGYVLEIFGGHFELPNLGLIGANGRAVYGAECTPQIRSTPNPASGFRV
jgi:homogentisate 1,2-dioxygenase